jgi:ribosome-associated heat shock protein Hsp15
MDKWLWAARFFKPAREVRVGDWVRVKNEAGEFRVEVLLLSEMRGPAAVAQGMYREPAESVELRKAAAEERKAGLVSFEKPSKRERREMDRFRGR